jgi:hypothetical protein
MLCILPKQPPMERLRLSSMSSDSPHPASPPPPRPPSATATAPLLCISEVLDYLVTESSVHS